MMILRMATDSLSKVKVRFMKIAERIGSVVFAILVGWVMVCFTTMSMHTAPLARNFLFEGFVPEEEGKFLGMATDQQWLGFMQKMSRGAFSRSGTEGELKSEKYVFDSRDEFMRKYATRRDSLEVHLKSTGKIRVN
jgi:hypothetical protein